LKKVSLKSTNHPINTTISLVSSKSESNRALIINAITGFRSQLKNISTARDSQTMKRLLNASEHTADVLDAGTTMRFLTAYYAITSQHRYMTGTSRMCERPIGILVECLKKLGAKIKYDKIEGFPPLIIEGFESSGNNEIEIKGDVSSQFISALLMVAPILPNGLTLRLLGEVGSKPYIEMTIAQMRMFGAEIELNWEENLIKVNKVLYTPTAFTVESDWSGASYWYSLVALANEATITLKGLKENSLQGDSAIVQIMNSLGVKTTFIEGGLSLEKSNANDYFEYDFSNSPDLAQTVAVVCAAKGIKAKFTGLESLKVKETDRVLALQKELKKFGANLIEVKKNEVYELQPSVSLLTDKNTLEFETYDDHRMAMAFAPLALLRNVIIQNPEVVNKSYPSFWDDFGKVMAVKEL
jgi:3-phosphoshikimate 1-carboxyvinyltransferase